MGNCLKKSNELAHPLIQHYDTTALNYSLLDVHNFLCYCQQGNMYEISKACRKNPQIIHAKCYIFTHTNGNVYNWYGRNGFMQACIDNKIEVVEYFYLRDKTVAECVDETGNSIFNYTFENKPKITEMLNSIKTDLKKFKFDKCPICQKTITRVIKIYGVGDTICPMCTGNVENPLATNCGHVFCANCICK